MKKNRMIIGILIVALLIGAFHSSADVMKTQAAKSTQQQVIDKEKETKEIKEKLDDQKDDIKGMKGAKTSLQDEMVELNETMLEVCANLVDLEGKISEKTADEFILLLCCLVQRTDFAIVFFRFLIFLVDIFNILNLVQAGIQRLIMRPQNEIGYTQCCR